MRRPFAIPLLAALIAAETAQAAANFETAEIAPGNHVHFGHIAARTPQNLGDTANVGFIAGSRCVLVVDAGGSLAVGRSLRDAIRRVTDKPVCYVVLTHVHPDHFFGAAAFAGDAPQFVAHENYRAQLSARARHYVNALRRDLGDAADGSDVIQPTILVKDRMEIDLGGRTVVVQAWPVAHTDNDLTVLDRETQTLWLSDLLFIGHTPVIDGSITGYLSVMDRLQALRVARYVPGHGRPDAPWPAALKPQRRYLEGVLRETRAALRARKTLQQATEEVGLAEAGRWALFELFHRRNVTTAYTELEWE